MHIHGGDIYTYQNMLDFSANINPLGIPEGIVQAAAQAAAQAAGYPDTQCRELRRALARHEEVPPQQLIFGNGAADLIFMLTLAQKPKNALLIAPGFHEYEQALRAVDCRIKYHYLAENEGFQLNPARLCADITPDLDLLFLCNPNNPTGLALTRQELLPIVECCQQNGVLLTLDECFNEFLDHPAEHTLKPLLNDCPNLFILKAFTKIYAMPGLRLGYGLCANAGLLQRLEEVSQPWRVSTPAQKAGTAALREGEYVARAQELVRQERAFLRQEMAGLKLQVYASQANYIFFRLPAELPADYDLSAACRAQGVLIRDCSNYVGLAPGFYRVAVRTRPENEKLLAALGRALEQGGKANA